MDERKETPTPVGAAPGPEGCDQNLSDLPVTDNIASDGTEIKFIPSSKIRPPTALMEWNEDLNRMVPVGDLGTRELHDKAEPLRDRLIARPTHPLEPHALLSDLLALGIDRDSIKEMVPTWPGLKPLDAYALDQAINRALVFHKEPDLRRYQRRFFVLKEYGGKVRLCWYDTDGDFRHRATTSWKEAEATVRVEVPDGKGGTKRVPAADVWYYSPDRNEYETAEFRPGQYVAPDVLNLWRGWTVGYHPQGSPYKAELFLHHIRENMCGGDEVVYEWFMGWMADAVQNVHRTAGTAVILQGPQGAGKNFWAERFMQLFAPHTLMLTNPKHMTGNFNSHLMDKLIVFANEALYAKNGGDAAALKALVTDDTMMVEPKGVDAFQVKKHFRLIMASNNAHVADIDTDDRRFLVLNVDAMENNNCRDYFREIDEEWTERGGREQFLTYLWHWDLSDWDEGKIPETRAKSAQKEQSLKGPWQWMMMALHDGSLPVAAYDPVSGHVFVLTADLPGSSKTFGAALRAAGGFGGDTSRESLEGVGQQRGWWLPDLSRARRTFARQVGVCPEWLEETAGKHWSHTANAANIPASEKVSKISDLF